MYVIGTASYQATLAHGSDCLPLTIPYVHTAMAFCAFFSLPAQLCRLPPTPM